MKTEERLSFEGGGERIAGGDGAEAEREGKRGRSGSEGGKLKYFLFCFLFFLLYL